MAKKQYQLEDSGAQAPEALAENAVVLAAPDAGQMEGMMHGFEVKSRPPVIKPGKMKVGEVVYGTITDIIACPIDDYDGRWLEIALLDPGTHRPNKLKVMMPITTVIGSALGEDEKRPTGADAFKGHDIIIRREGTGKSRKFKGKSVNLFSVATRAPANRPAGWEDKPTARKSSTARAQA